MQNSRINILLKKAIAMMRGKSPRSEDILYIYIEKKSNNSLVFKEREIILFLSKYHVAVFLHVHILRAKT